MEKPESRKRPLLKERVEMAKELMLSPRSKRNIKRFLMIMGVIFILVLLFFVLSFMLQLNLMLKGDVLISISPSNKNILTQSRDPNQIMYDIRFENRIFCRADCEYAFVDLSNNETIDIGSLSVKDGENLTLNYTIKPPEKGAGQLAYELNVRCNNRKSSLCRTQGLTRQKSSFLTLSYELSIKERDLIENISSTIKKDLIDLKRLDIESKEIAYENEILKKRLHLLKIEEMIIAIQQDLIQSIIVSDEMRKLWAEEEYMELTLKLNNLSSQINDLNRSLNIVKRDISFHINSFIDLNQIMSNSTLIVEGYKNLTKIDAILEKDTTNHLAEYSKLINRFNSNNYSGYDQLKNEKDEIDNSITLDLSKSREDLGSVNKMGGLILKDRNITLGAGNDLILEHQKICYTIADLSNKSVKEIVYGNNYCIENLPELNVSLYNLSVDPLPNIEKIEFDSQVNTSLAEHLPVCCIFDECAVCCEGESCIDSDEKYPIILVHGHAISEESSIENSLMTFQMIRRELVKDGFIDGGTIYPNHILNDHEKGVLGKYGKPVLISTTYYVGLTESADQGGNIFHLISKDEDIGTYAERLKEVIDTVKFKTGSKKVNILAHSMGGLVTRKYLVDFGEESVNKMILIGTPNKGVEGKIESFCSLTGNQKECSQMPSTSSFINDLNSPENKPKQVKAYVIYGKGCIMNGKEGDGVVPAENVKLPYALNFEIEGRCADTTLHEDLLNIYKYPETYDLLKNILQN